MRKILSLLICSVFVLTVPAFAQVSLDSWDFGDKPELLERLSNTQEEIDEKIREAQESNNQELTQALEETRQHVQMAIESVKKADQKNWDNARREAQRNLSPNSNLYEEGYWDRNRLRSTNTDTR